MRFLDAGLSQASDPEIWLYAAEHHLVLISKDKDFFHRVCACLEAGERIVEAR